MSHTEPLPDQSGSVRADRFDADVRAIYRAVESSVGHRPATLGWKRGAEAEFTVPGMRIVLSAIASDQERAND